MKKKKINRRITKSLRLDNDPMTIGVTTFKNILGNSIIACMMPSDFDEWESVMITYKANKILI